MECNQLASYARPSSVNNELASDQKNTQLAIYIEPNLLKRVLEYKEKQDLKYSTSTIKFIFSIFGGFSCFFNSGKSHAIPPQMENINIKNLSCREFESVDPKILETKSGKKKIFRIYW